MNLHRYSQLEWKPIVSSGFGFDPFTMPSNIRKFYERWHSQGGESARDCAGIMKRAKNFPDLRSVQEQVLWKKTSWKLSQHRALIRQAELSQEIKRGHLRVIK